MKSVLFLISIILVSCNQQKGNSHSQDKVVNEAIEQASNTEQIDLDQFINNDTNDGSTGFSEGDGEILTSASMSIIAISCRRCHGGFPTTNEEWISSKYITTGDPDGSLLIDRTKGCGRGDQGAANMPTNGDQISEENCNTLKIWIEYLHQLENESL